MSLILKLNFIGIKRILKILTSITKHGFNLLVLLDSAKDIAAEKACIEDDFIKLSYNELYQQTISLAGYLQTKHQIKATNNIVILGDNSVLFVKSLFAVSSLGTNVYLLNPNQKEDYYDFFFTKNKIDLVMGPKQNEQNFENKQIPYFCFEKDVDDIKTSINNRNQKWKSSTIVILSSGSKGKPKNEKRKLSVLQYLNPLIDIIKKLDLKGNKSVLISVPVFHGYGLAALFLSLFMNQKIRLSSTFNPEKTLTILKKEKTNCWIAVPLMIQKVTSLGKIQTTGLQKIISGGDVLPPAIVESIQQLKTIAIYNLYGTSETGVCTIATNDDLKRYPQTIGKAIMGVKTTITDTNQNLTPNDQIGNLSVKCAWAADNKNKTFEPTGDMVSKNSEGYFFYKGRNDDLMIIGGENIYPIEIESSLYKNPKIKWVKARKIYTENGFPIIHIDLVLEEKTQFDENLKDWMTKEIPKYMIPKSITILETEPVLKLM